MDNCVVCCQSCENTLSRIDTLSNEWKEWNIQRIIEKHLWWWYLRPSRNSGKDQWICRPCWLQLSSFHNFYVKVEKENQLKNELLLALEKNDNKHEVTTVDIKVEEQNFENTTVPAESALLSNKRRRGRKRKAVEKPERHQMEEIPIVEIKYENETNDSSEAPHAEIDVDVLVHEGIGSIDGWENCFLDENAEITDEENEFKEIADKLSIIPEKRSRQKVKTKSTPVTKYRKKYTKTKKEKKIKVMTKSADLNAMKRNDKFIADNQFQLSCCICSTLLENFNCLKVHFRKEHATLGYAMCCNKKFYKRGILVDHLNVHKDPDYFKCLQCNKSLSTRRSYEKHLETHQLYETRHTVFTCEKCDKSFLKKPVYERHILTHVPEEERTFQCTVCEKKFASEYLRKQHNSLTHSKKYAKICDICGKLLRDSFSFIRHMAEHKGETIEKVECEICGAQLTNKYRLNRHKKMMHTEENQQEQICPYCSKVSPNLNAHRHHVKYTHTLERKHACNMCDKKFRRPLELKEHLSTHTGEPLYTCPHCPRTFISSGNMHKHRRLTHRKEWEEGRLKKEAKALAGKNFLKAINAAQNESAYPELEILDPGNESVTNLAVLEF